MGNMGVMLLMVTRVDGFYNVCPECGITGT